MKWILLELDIPKYSFFIDVDSSEPKSLPYFIETLFSSSNS